MSEISTSIAGAVEEQSVATRDVSSNITGVSQGSQEASRSTAAVVEVAQSLSQQAADLDQQVEQFLVRVRSM